MSLLCASSINGSPLPLIVLIIFLVLLIITSVVSKKRKAKQENEDGKDTKNKRSMVADGKAEAWTEARREEPAGYYRYQEDKQVVLKRTEEQKRVFDEYFVVRNVKTTTCEPELKKKSVLFNNLFYTFLIIGLVLAFLGLSNSISELLIFGIVVLVIGIIFKVVSTNYLKKFNQSKNVKIEPKKLMSDKDYEEYLFKKIDELNLKERGLKKLGLDDSQINSCEPIVLSSLVIEDTSLVVFNTNTQIVHSSTHEIGYLYFTSDKIYAYKYRFDVCCDIEDEWASEFSYDDICDVPVYTKNRVYESGEFFYTLSTTQLGLVVTNAEISFHLNHDEDQDIRKIKQIIRENQAKQKN